MPYTAMTARSAGDTILEADWDAFESNIGYLLTQNHESYSGQLTLTTTSTSFVDADATNLNLEITTYGGRVLVLLMAPFGSNSVGVSVPYLTVTRNGTNLGHATYGLYTHVVTGTIGSTLVFVDEPAAGTHTYKVQYRGTAGGATISLGGGQQVVFSVSEF